MENDTIAVGDAAAPCEPVSDAVGKQRLLVLAQDSLLESQSQSDAQEAESVRQRRLGSFELLDAAMDNVVEHDGNDEDDHVIVESQALTDHVEHVDAEQTTAVTKVYGNAAEAGRIAINGDIIQDNGPTSESQHEGVSTSANTSLQAPHILTFIESDGAGSEANTPDDIVSVPANAADDLSGSVLPAPASVSAQYVPVEAPRTTQEAVVIFEKCEPELLQWIQARQTAEHGKRLAFIKCTCCRFAYRSNAAICTTLFGFRTHSLA